MACAVLARVPFVTVALVLIAPSFAQDKDGKCPADLSVGSPADKKNNVRAFQQAVKAGPFYKELSRRGGKPRSCAAVVEGDNITVSYSFRGNTSLVSQVSLGIEGASQSMQLRIFTAKGALAL
jgi:hypothetical protein